MDDLCIYEKEDQRTVRCDTRSAFSLQYEYDAYGLVEFCKLYPNTFILETEARATYFITNKVEFPLELY